jgi:dihydroorotase
MIDTLTITRPDDWHLHLRDGLILEAVLPHSARQFGRAIVMPNLNPPIVTVKQARFYYERILSTLRPDSGFKPLMTLYLTEDTSPDEILRAKNSDLVFAVKLYPAGATTNSSAGVTNFRKCYKTFEAMQELGLPLLIHGEVVDPEVDIFDRERIFIDRVMKPLRYDMPELKIVLEHITTREAVQYVESANEMLAATITAHHLLYNRNKIFRGGINPHYYCLPILKREHHRQEILRAATSGNKHFFLGTDSAPHPKGSKENSCGCAGCYTAMHAMELYTQIFDQSNALEQLEKFASFNGPDFYNLPRNHGQITLKRCFWNLPTELPLGGGTTLVPFMGGEPLGWKLI